MKAIFSFFSYPFFTHSIKGNGEFYDLEMFFNSFVLSCMLAHKHFGKIELYTDTFGKLMLEKLNLPFENIHTVLDNLTENEKHFWAVSKIKTHLYQREPYVMIDYDVYLWDQLPKHMLNAEILCQNIEVHKLFYDRSMNSYLKDCKYGHPIIDQYLQKHGLKVYAPNVGIVGGHRIDLLKEYATIILDIINNAENVKSPYINIPMFLEQWFLGMFCQYHNIKIKSFGVGYGWWERLHKYTHLQAGCKKEPINGRKNAERLKNKIHEMFPEFKRHIESSMRNLNYEGSGGRLLYENYLQLK